MSTPESWTILRVLDWTREWFEKKAIENPRLDAEVLIAHTLGLQRVMLYAQFDRPLTEEELGRIRELVKRRAQREPVAYITGRREFWSLDFEVDSNVLIPRPDTELLIETAVELGGPGGFQKIADVGTGSGCIAIAIAKEMERSEVEAYDISEPACALARRNVDRHGLSSRVRIVQSDLLSSASRSDFDLIAANLPYVTTAEMAELSQDVRAHEPELALRGGEDGLELIRRLVEDAKARLSPGGFLLLEAGARQLGQVAQLLEASGYSEVSVRRDYGGHPRLAIARTPKL